LACQANGESGRFVRSHVKCHVTLPDERQAVAAVKRALAEPKNAVIKVTSESVERVYEALKLKPGDVLIGAQPARSKNPLGGLLRRFVGECMTDWQFFAAQCRADSAGCSTVRRWAEGAGDPASGRHRLAVVDPRLGAWLARQGRYQKLSY
jgi:hypothetical protein